LSVFLIPTRMCFSSDSAVSIT